VKPKFWRWQENVLGRRDPSDWRDGQDHHLSASTSAPCRRNAVLVVDGELYGYNSMRTGNNSPDSAANALQGRDGAEVRA
jgi:benzoyl-CoA reductase subunit A